MAKKKKTETIEKERFFFKYIGPLKTVTTIAGVIGKEIPFEIDIKYVPELKNKDTFVEVTLDEYENWQKEKEQMKKSVEDMLEEMPKIKEQIFKKEETIIDNKLEEKEFLDDNESGDKESDKDLL